MRAQRAFVVTTLLHSGAKFHSFLYTGSETVPVNMESCYGGMSTWLKQSAVTEFLGAENVTPARYFTVCITYQPPLVYDKMEGIWKEAVRNWLRR